MIHLLAHILAKQPIEPTNGEGLPYWALWFLLCIIILLIFFIFLRDKSLRQRLNLFFSRAKRRLVKMRLQARLKKENRKREQLIQELGREAWAEGVNVEKSEKILKELKSLGVKENVVDKELYEAEARIDKLESQNQATLLKHNEQVQKKEEEIKPFREKMAEAKEKLNLIELSFIQKQKDKEYAEKILDAEEKNAKEIKTSTKLSDEEKKAKKKGVEENIKNLEKKKEKVHSEIQDLREKKKALEKEIAEYQKKIFESENKIKSIEKEKKEQTRHFQKEIKDWKKNKEKAQKKIKDIEKHKEPLFESLGKTIEKYRVTHKMLSPYYTQIDRAKRRIKEIEDNIKNL